MHCDPFHKALDKYVYEVYVSKTKLLSDFPEETQQLIVATYRFAPTIRTAGGSQQVQMIRNTLELI